MDAMRNGIGPRNIDAEDKLIQFVEERCQKCHVIGRATVYDLLDLVADLRERLKQGEKQ